MSRAKMLNVISEINNEVAERSELVEAIAIALLTRRNVFILGDTGQAKSYAINLFRNRIIGAHQFERLLSKQTDEEALFGRIDLKSMIAGDPKMVTKGKIPEAHIVFLDELFKSNEGLLNALLTALNERKYTNESETLDIPTISFFSASNEIPNFNDPSENILRPLYDRFDLKIRTQYIEDRDTRLQMLKRKQEVNCKTTVITISLEELYSMQEEVKKVTVPNQINELMDDVLCQLRALGIHVSDRKYLNYYPLVCAKAWLSGRNTVESPDMLILKNYLWNAPEEITVVQETLERLCVNPLEEKLAEIILIAQEQFDDFLSNLSNKNSIKKFRSELTRIFDMLTELLVKNSADKDKQLIDATISKIEDLSKEAHNKTMFTYIPLHELKELAA